MATAAAVTESRSDLLNWINNLLQINETKIEQVGKGAILCQIMDSIYGDLPMHKVKFDTYQEYEYINNFKLLQSCFTRHGIDKVIPVDRLIKLKMQDNLEFLQWMKKFWECNCSMNTSYDAIGRRKGLKSTLTAVEMTTSTAANLGRSGRTPLTSSNPIPPTLPNNNTNVSKPNPVTSTSQLQQQHTALQKTVTELQLTVDEMEKERDFYFGKLRDIEIVCQEVSDKTVMEGSLFKGITEILYKTEDGFEVPNEESAN